MRIDLVSPQASALVRSGRASAASGPEPHGPLSPIPLRHGSLRHRSFQYSRDRAVIGATLAGRRERDRRHRIIRELALDQDWRVVPLVDDLRHRYPVLSLDSAVSAQAELAVGGRRGATAVVLASVLVRRPSGAGGHRGPEDVILLAQAGIPGPLVPVVVEVGRSAAIELRGQLPRGLADALSSAAENGEFRSGEVVVWNGAGLAHLARIPHLTAAGLDRHLALLDTLLAAV